MTSDPERRLERAMAHRDAQRIEGDVIRAEIERERRRNDATRHALAREVTVLREQNGRLRYERDMWEPKAKRRSLLEMLLGVKRA